MMDKMPLRKGFFLQEHYFVETPFSQREKPYHWEKVFSRLQQCLGLKTARMGSLHLSPLAQRGSFSSPTLAWIWFPRMLTAFQVISPIQSISDHGKLLTCECGVSYQFWAYFPRCLLLVKAPTAPNQTSFVPPSHSNPDTAV